MPTIIVFGNINEFYPFDKIPAALLTAKLRQPATGNTRILRRYEHSRLAHFLLWRSLKMYGIDPALLSEIYTTDSGRPQFPAEHIEFNISNSGNWVAVIVNIREAGMSREKSAVGIDIESPHKQRDFIRLLQHFAPQEEIQWFRQQQDQSSAFYRCWCLREAVLKSQGVGILKLSEVDHQPIKHRIYSAYCPQGQFIFTDELPFYLAVFAAGNALNDARYFHWHSEKLNEIQLQSSVDYHVNFG
ncbi:4'-phosphopantetheinyl transferase [Cricetibacter osteomyelitidis]|uniref:4'-phosphopantetheinyl transferase n=1 Tax=Cricetibacter osteomyelitidis TaxID=1521931 RepID=A0A4R2TPN5_9PAST|nr:4'-phosphopantetheinyl transferase superfamily protein [Cricetibacter osteomyelitidis]TCP96942.1 4'-phosphopantetheinyl transferase [Cricetibacter osteomyelitidis]